MTSFDRDARLTASVPDLLQSSVATLDLMTGELLERGTYLPSGVRETLHSVRDKGAFQLEPVGFTGKEGDDEVGFGLGPATTGVLHDEDSIHSFSGEGNAGGSSHTRQSIRDELREVWARELDAVADLAAHLDSIPEIDGDGTMLDHTVITYVADNGCGHNATARDYPTLIVGGGALGLRTGGRAVLYPEYKAGTAGRRELVNLWSTYGVALVGGEAGSDGCLAGFGDSGSRLAGGNSADLISPM